MSPPGRLLSLAAGTLPDCAPAAMVEASAAAGWPACGIWFDPATWSPATGREVRRRLDDTGLVALDIEPVILGPDGDPAERLVAAGAEVGARFVLCASRHPDRAATVDRFGRVCDLAAAAGMTVVLEFLPVFAVRTLADAVAVIRAAGRPNSGVLVDTLHLARSGGHPTDLADLPAPLLPYLQVADAPAAGPADVAGLLDEALHGRLLPGEGALPIGGTLAAVPGVPLSLEIRSRALRDGWPDPVERARRVLLAATALLGDGQRPVGGAQAFSS